MQLPPQAALLNVVKEKYSHIYAIISPPRCSSTAFARVFWEHPSIRYYSHEPFELTYYAEAGIEKVHQKLLNPLDLCAINSDPSANKGEALVIKEMPYQVWHNFPLLAELATKPLVFLIRDPRINIASRMNKKCEVGDSPYFPHIETGWELLNSQIAQCQTQNIPYLIVDGADFRNKPDLIFPQIFEALSLEFSPAQLSWQPQTDLDLDNLGGAHRHLYYHVLNSAGMEPDRDVPPPLSSFPAEHGVRNHVAACLQIYKELQADPARIKL